MVKAKRPATGFNASAAWLDVWISTVPATCSVAAVVTVIAKATRLEKPMPT